MLFWPRPSWSRTHLTYRELFEKPTDTHHIYIINYLRANARNSGKNKGDPEKRSNEKAPAIDMWLVLALILFQQPCKMWSWNCLPDSQQLNQVSTKPKRKDTKRKLLHRNSSVCITIWRKKDKIWTPYERICQSEEKLPTSSITFSSNNISEPNIHMDAPRFAGDNEDSGGTKTCLYDRNGKDVER